MEEFIICIDKRIILVYMSVTVAAILYFRKFDSYIFSCLIITLFEGFMQHIKSDLSNLVKVDLPGLLHEHRTVFWYGGWILINLFSILVIRQGHRMLEIKLSKLAVVYMIAALLMIVLQIVGYVDNVYFDNTTMVNIIYAMGIDIIRVCVAIIMLMQFILIVRIKR